MKQNLFIYGTLEEPPVEKKIIGRVLKLHHDVLKGFKKTKAKLEGGVYFIISPNKKSSVCGFIISITPSELKKIDCYEGKDYKRVKVKLVSGKQVWVYERSRDWFLSILHLIGSL